MSAEQTTIEVDPAYRADWEKRNEKRLARWFTKRLNELVEAGAERSDAYQQTEQEQNAWITGKLQEELRKQLGDRAQTLQGSNDGQVLGLLTEIRDLLIEIRDQHKVR